jgi:hypothetical protein
MLRGEELKLYEADRLKSFSETAEVEVVGSYSDGIIKEIREPGESQCIIVSH